MHQRLGLILGCLVFLVAGSLDASAQSYWWRDKDLKDRLVLTAAQSQEIESIFSEYLKARLDVQSTIGKARLELNGLLAQEKLDDKEVKQAADELSKARQNLFKEMVGMKLAVRKILTPTQIELLLAENPDIFSTITRWAGRQKRVVKKGRVILKEGEDK